MNGFESKSNNEMIEKITSFQNPRLKLVKKLRDKKARQSEQRFVIDDPRDLQRALASGYSVDFALYCPELGDFVNGLPHRKTFEVSRDMLEKSSYRSNPTAVVAVLHQKPVRGVHDLHEVSEQPILGLVNLEKPGNIGALLRTADAAGFNQVFLIDSELDLYNPNIIRASTGACFTVNVYDLTADQARTFFKKRGFKVIGTHLEGSENLYDLNYDVKTALLLGTEDVGLDESWIEHCDHLVRIPMTGQVADSLNVSVSGAIVMYEMLRQRLFKRHT